MISTNWEDSSIIKRKLTSANFTKKIKKSGLPVLYDNNKLYIDNRTNNTLIIGASGSGKTQTIILPQLELIRLAFENAIVHDTTSKIYEMTKDKFLNDGYKVVKIDFNNLKGFRYWNPLEVLYKDKNNVFELGYYLFNDIEEFKESNILNIVINYFSLLTLYAMEVNNLSFKTIYSFNLKIRNGFYTFYSKIPKHIKKEVDVSGLLKLEDEKKEVIFKIFDKRMRRFTTEEMLRKITKNSFNLESLKTEKTIIYLVSNEKSSLTSLLISQIYDEFKYNSFKKTSVNKIRMNIILDDFYLINPISNISEILRNCKRYKIKFTIIVRRLNDLKNNYGIREYRELNFNNTIYILADDSETLNELCHAITENEHNKSLILQHELKALDSFEMIFLLEGTTPFKTKLIPYYKIKNWK